MNMVLYKQNQLLLQILLDNKRINEQQLKVLRKLEEDPEFLRKIINKLLEE